MTIRFIRPAPYTYQLHGRTLFDSYDLIAKGTVEPQINEQVVRDFAQKSLGNKTSFVVSSPTQRAQLTAKILNEKFVVLDELKELEFSMSEIISHKEFDQLESNATDVARQRFFIALFQSKLSESLDQAYERAESLLQKIISMEDTTVIISHGFFMKYFAVFCQDKKAGLDYEKFTRYYDGSKQSYDFLKGFTISVDSKGVINDIIEEKYE